ncbi:uncharacterized protein [Periplaneta americana]|uniref:uncharacterized protein isoform X2 n=1 Tax=Periplaneta americana TaxID=6978 RepID=UPI0037E77FF9
MTGMSAKEKQRAYRKCKEAREGKKPKKFPKTGAERSREWRARIVRDSKNKRNSSRPNETHPANSFHYEQVKVENLEAFPSSGCETLVNIKSEDDISSDNNVQIKCEPNFDGENDPLNANDLSSNYEGEINCQMNSSCDDDPLSTRNTSLNEECEINYQVSVKNEVDPLNTLDMSLTDEVKIECQSNSDYEDDQWCRQSNCNEGVRVKEEKKDSGESAIS